MKHLSKIAAILSLAVLSGCASMRQYAARQEFIMKKTLQHEYEMPLAQVWPQARTILFEMGYEVKDTGEGGSYTLATEWRHESMETVRYLVQGVNTGSDSCKVLFTRAIKGTTGGGFSGNTNYGSSSSQQSNRDWQVEWNLIQRADPQAAAQINSGADIAGQAAYASPGK